MVKGQIPPSATACGPAAEFRSSIAMIAVHAPDLVHSAGFRFQLDDSAAEPAVDIWHCQFDQAVAHLSVTLWRCTYKLNLPDFDVGCTAERN